MSNTTKRESCRGKLHATNNAGPPQNTQRNERLLLSAESVAAMLDLSVRQVWRKVSNGELVPPLRTGGSTRWRCEDLEAWVAAGCPRVE